MWQARVISRMRVRCWEIEAGVEIIGLAHALKSRISAGKELYRDDDGWDGGDAGDEKSGLDGTPLACHWHPWGRPGTGNSPAVAALWCLEVAGAS